MVVGTGRREQAGGAAAAFAFFRIKRTVTVDISGSATDIADGPVEELLFFQFFHAAENGIFRAGNKEMVLVGNKSAESASAGTAPHDRDGIFDGLESRDPFRVDPVGSAHIGELADRIKLLRLQRRLGRFHHKIAVAVLLKQTLSAPRVHLTLHLDRLGHDGIRIFAECFVIRQQDRVFVRHDLRRFLRTGEAGSSGDTGKGFAFFQALEDLQCGSFSHAIDQDVRFAVDKERWAHLVLPVVVMSDPPETRLHPAEDRWFSGKCSLAELGIDHRRMGWFQPRLSAGRKHIFMTHAASRRIDANHGVHVAAGDGTADRGRAEGLERVGILPVRLGDHADTIARIHQQTPDQSRTERRMVHIGITGNKQDVNRIPFAGFHLFPGQRDKSGQIVFGHKSLLRSLIFLFGIIYHAKSKIQGDECGRGRSRRSENIFSLRSPPGRQPALSAGGQAASGGTAASPSGRTCGIFSLFCLKSRPAVVY